VLYTGGDDYRKNLEGAVAGYAELPESVRRDTQLMIVCSMTQTTRHALSEAARKLRLGQEELVMPGFVAEADLAALYNLCDAFFFPSLYEGFGLPVLEAMRCGAPVVGADNSGVRELIGRDDALFDARRPAAIAERLVAVLEQSDFREELRRHGTERAKQFTWERSAALALEALRDAHARMQGRATVAVAAALPKRRLALFTPLPPCRSGIADYNAFFLPQLARYFDIDIFIDDYEVADPYLRDHFIIRPFREFTTRRGDYDGIVYEMGNSEFHAYMLDTMARYPGIVVLHDAYLSGLYGYVDFQLGRSGAYSRELLVSHGPRARRYLAPVQRDPDPIGATMINLPATRSVIESAIGVISHTPFNIDVARQNYSEGIATPYRIIKQMVRIPEAIDPERRRALRATLGFSDADFVICTFGHITWTKCGDVLLDAFVRSALARDSNAKLIYVGELARDAFGHRLRRAIDSSDLGQRIRVTGYLDEHEYANYLAAADLAVQLRTQSRGGASKAILDCLAYGLPLIANDAGSFTDYPADVIHKIAPVPDAGELAEKLTSLLARRDVLRELGAAGRKHIIRDHGPEGIAAQYAVAIDEFLHRSSLVSLPSTLAEVGGALADGNAKNPPMRQVAAALHEDLARPLFARQRILVDVTHITDTDHQTGIQRVVRNIVRWLYCSNRAGFEAVAVRLDVGTVVHASKWLRTQGLLVGNEGAASEHEEVIDLRWGDILLMLDSSWAKIDACLPIFEEVRRHRGKVYSVIYDLLPIRFPHLFVEGGAAWFAGWLVKAIRGSDGFICISRAVADELEAFISSLGSRRWRRVGFWHLGCDFQRGSNATASERVRRATSGRTLLMVGTIEPRKNHELALDATELLWARGVDVNLCIAGKRGWMVDKFMSRLTKHAESGRRLRFIDNPTDEELLGCYAQSTALLAPSVGEGFGLPLIEAAQFGTPILASDIPVFREIAAEHATYLPIGTPGELAASLEPWLALQQSGTTPRSDAIPRLTWEQSAEQLLDVLLRNRWYKLSPEIGNP
jgi:glycosyltransferase involved in cell wall biosynthesis